VLKHAAAVVNHGGHGTVIKTLAAGVPQVCLPLGRDQLDNAARVEWHGAGLRLKPDAEATAIASAVRRVIDEPSFAAGARRLADGIAEDMREDRAVAELEELAASRTSRMATAA
jgi:UDP:flavonoid glycosyltransferase YjiC (YdhE family)